MDSSPAMGPPPIDLSKPRWDQTTYVGRAKHFFYLTNPLNILATDSDLDEAKKIVDAFKTTKKLPPGMTEDQLWQTKYLCDSAFHPDTGEKMFVLCRMSAQAPMNTLITAGMITFYKTTPQTVFWQWLNQTFNAGVNYTNRSGDKPVAKSRLVASYLAACGGALGTALYLNSKVKKMKPVYARLVPFAAVAAANCINIPMMRSSEISHGTPVSTASGQKIGESQRAAVKGIGLVVISRVIMALPGMTVVPVITNAVAARGTFCRHPRLEIPLQMLLVGLCVTFATPLCCAIFQQRASIGVDSLEPDLQKHVKSSFPKEKEVYFNKGL